MGGDHSNRAKAKSTDAISGQQYREEVAGNNGRAYYECTFCKMGFSNAQALGGHMNIHRRDRPRTQPKQPKVEFEMGGAAGYGYHNSDADATYYWPRVDAYCSTPPVSTFPAYFPSSSSGGMGRVDAHMISSGMPPELGLYGEDLRLSLDIGGRAAEEGEIDLELRLGR